VLLERSPATPVVGGSVLQKYFNDVAKPSKGQTISALIWMKDPRKSSVGGLDLSIRGVAANPQDLVVTLAEVDDTPGLCRGFGLLEARGGGRFGT
jgi:hypothetical protein